MKSKSDRILIRRGKRRSLPRIILSYLPFIMTQTSEFPMKTASIIDRGRVGLAPFQCFERVDFLVQEHG